MTIVIAANLVTATKGLCTAFGHANVVQFSLAFELRERSDGYLHGNVGVDAGALEQVEALSSSQLFVHQINVPSKILWAENPSSAYLNSS